MVVFIEAKVFQLRYACKSLRFLVIEPNIFKNRFGLYLFYANTSLNNCSYLLVNNFKIANNNNDSSQQLGYMFKVNKRNNRQGVKYVQS